MSPSIRQPRFAHPSDRLNYYLVAALTSALCLIGSAAHATPWVPSATISPIPTIGVPASADVHPGKEYSSELDADAAGALDSGQVVLWDGVGGTADGVDLLPAATGLDGEVDAIANHGDALYTDVNANATAIAFSLRNLDPLGGPPIGAGSDHPAAAVFYETTGGAIGTWATAVDVNDTAPPENLDGLEIWGPEGDTVADSDSDRYSLFGDAALGTSIFNFVGTTYLSHADLVAAMLGIDTSLANFEQMIDLDALMVRDLGVPELWGPGDSILFSLWPIIVPGAGPYFGDAVYRWDFGLLPVVLSHGGHLWVNGWTATAFGDVWNVDALEALANEPDRVPEPGSLALVGLGLAGLGAIRRRRMGR